MATVEFRGATRVYPGMDRPAVNRLDLEIADGELMVLVGPSGCGKSTALRMLAGLEHVDAGRILIDGVDVTRTPPRERDIAMVFQAYALYPHMTVEENISFNLQLRHERPDEIRRRVDETAHLLGIEELLHLRPSRLSGGQRQRVAMGRALIRDPKVFLMDEPLSNLDAKLRIHMRTEIASLQKRLGTTTLYVTHDQTEAMTLGDRVAVQRDGILLQCAPPMVLYDEPIDEFVAGFVGSPAMNLIPARVCEGVARVGGIEYRLTPAQLDALRGELVTLGIRPESWDIAPCGGLDAVVQAVEVHGSDTIVHCSTDADDRLAVHHRRCRVDLGEQVSLVPRSGEVHVFDAATTKRLAG